MTSQCTGLTPLGERARVSLLRSHGVQNLQGRAEQEELVSLHYHHQQHDDDDDDDDGDDVESAVYQPIDKNKNSNECLRN